MASKKARPAASSAAAEAVNPYKPGTAAHGAWIRNRARQAHAARAIEAAGGMEALIDPETGEVSAVVAEEPSPDERALAGDPDAYSIAAPRGGAE